MDLESAFRNRSIQIRLSVLGVLSVSFALLLVGVSLLGYEKFELHDAAAQALSIQAGIVANSSTAALSFTDKRAASEMLTALRSDPNLVQAIIYDEGGHLFAWRAQRGSESEGNAGNPSAQP